MSTPRTTTRRQRRRPAAGTVIKDWGLYLGGWGLIWHQALAVPPQDFNLTLALIGAALIGVPGASQLWALRTGGPLSPAASEDSSSQPPSSPIDSEAER
ncbi:hypothetical protein [Actinoplanes aureus]|uniref:Uncharacterized protein n=1 Tax=Actinoplanes aureus TaxID=2792083 RepID=A0A931C456_9ACTN|nr:hypothetical protein [Actinoplanes aureus]MBG0560736.1 hypothetical protein [Actinoplanes aureus]